MFPQAYCDTQVVNEVVLPLLSMSSSVLLCISTLRENDNFYSRMFQMRKPDGNLLFETIQIDLVCEACRASDHPERYVLHSTKLPAPNPLCNSYNIVDQVAC